MNFAELLAKVTGLEEKMTKSDNRIKTLATDLASQTERANAFETQVTDLTAKLTTLETEKADLTKQANEAKQEAEALKGENTELKGKLEDPNGTIQAEASKKAQTIVAQTGTPPVETDESGEGSAAGDSIVEQYQAIENPTERLKFFQKHHEQIHQAMAGVLN